MELKSYCNHPSRSLSFSLSQIPGFCVCFSLLLHPKHVYVIFLHFIHLSSVITTIYPRLSYSCPPVCGNFHTFVHTLLPPTAPADKVSVAAHQARLFLRSQQSFGWSTHSRDLWHSNTNCRLTASNHFYRLHFARDRQRAGVAQSV